MTVSAQLGDAALGSLRDEFHGEVLGPGDGGYEDARSIFNGMIDRKPAAIAQCSGAADVMTAVDFARERDLLVAVKGGGHNVAGNAVCDDGLMIDLSPMASVRVDPIEQTARVGPGATMADLDHETQAFGLVTTGGMVSTTGVAGLTLGGGFGKLCRKYGLAIDNLRSVDIVTADGELRRASETENSDLFWGVRGGGGNFGVVTSFEFDLHEFGPDVLAGDIVYPGEDAPEVLRHWRDTIRDAPDELSVWVSFGPCPPEPIVPEAYHGEPIVAVSPVYAGDVEAGYAAVDPFRTFGDPIVEFVEPQPYVELQQEADENYPAGDRYYWKSHNFSDPDEAVFDVLAEYALTVPVPGTGMSGFNTTHLGGAVSRVPNHATAYPHRAADFLVNIPTRWQDPARDDEFISWTRSLFDDLAPYATGGTYVNLISERKGEEAMAYGENYDRMVEVKTRYDPGNLFRMNQNVQPTG